MNTPATSHNPQVQYESQRRSPSKLKSLELSPLYLDDPTREEHPVTAEGTLMHKALETGDWAALNEEQTGLVQKCQDYLDSLKTEYTGWSNNELVLEILPGMRGRLDTTLFNQAGNKAVIVDFKFGFNSQEPVETNPAAQAYVFGLFDKFKTLKSLEVCYLYPRRDEVSRHVYTRNDYQRIKLRLETIIARCDEADKTGVCSPHDQTCMWCARKGTCKQLHALVLPIATRYAQSGLNQSVKDLGVEVQTFDPSLIRDPATMAKALVVASVAEEWAGSVKYHANKLREGGVEIPGYEWQSRNGKKTITNAKLTWEVVEGQITTDQYLGCVKVSVKELLDAVAENAPRGKKGTVKQQLEDTLRDKGLLEVGAETFFLKRSKT
jgi:hypothetical protein